MRDASLYRRAAGAILIGASMLFAGAAPAQDGPKLVAHWKCDEGTGIATADASGAANHAALMGGTGWVPGIDGQALNFDGVRNYAIGGASGFADVGTPHTISLWFNAPAIPPNIQQFIHVNNPNDGTGVYIGFKESKVGAWKGGGWWLVNANAPSPNGWHHLAYVFDGKTHQMYVDGVLSGMSTHLPDKGVPTAVELGRRGAGQNPEQYKGALDEIRIYTGALTAGDLKQIVPADKLAKGPSGGAVLPPPPGAPPAGKSTGRAAPTDPKAQEREKKAQDLYDAALALEKDGKFPEAQAKLREFRSRYRGTWVYSDHMIEVSDKITAIGLKLAVAALSKTALYKRPHQDSWYGFEFQPPDGWKGVPPAAAWFNDYDNSEIDYKGETIRIARYTAPYLDKLYLQVFKVYSCSGLDFLEQKVTSTLEQRGYKKLKEEAKSQGQGRAPYLRKVYSTEGGDRCVAYYYFAEKRGLALVGTWKSGSDENSFIRIITTTSDGKRTVQQTTTPPITQEDFGHALKLFDAAAKTFWILDPGTRSGLSIKLEKGALCSDWQLLRSSKGNYLIEYATSPEYAKKCGEELEQIQALYRQAIPSAKGIPQCRVKVFDREEDFMYYGQMPGAAAYWSPGQEEVVCYKFEGDKVTLDSNEEFTVAEERPVEETTFKVLYHEAFHQYMFYMMGKGRRIYVPSWLNEGLGDYFFGGEWTKNRGKFTIGINDWRVKTIVTAVKKNEHVALDKIFRFTQADYYRDAHLCYAEGWAINYFFQQSPVAKAKGYPQIPVKMLEALKTGGGGEDGWQKATDKAFTGVDLKKMEEEWKAFVAALPIPKSQMDKGDDDNK